MVQLAANLSFLFQELNFIDRFEAAAAEGFTTVEFMFPQEFAPATVAAALRDNGLRMALMNIPAGDWAAGERGLTALPDRRKDFRAAMARALDYAAAIEAPCLHVIAGLTPPGAERRAIEACYMDNLAWACQQASAAGVTLTIEPINQRDIPGFFLSDFDFAERVIRELNVPNLKLQFDIYHAQVIHGDVTHRLRRQMPWVGHVQIANPPDRREPGNGELDYDFLLPLLDDLGYAGWVGCEYRPSASTSDSLHWARPFGLKRR